MKLGLILGFALSISTVAQAAVNSSTTSVYLIQGDDVAPRVRSRISELIKSVPGLTVSEALANQAPEGSLVISIGNTPVTRSLISEKEVTEKGSEGFIVRSKTENGLITIATDGNAADGERTSMKTNRGLSFGAYEVLQQIGFHFNHPLAPQSPKALRIPSGAINVSEKPRWPARGLHLHTMHPIELTHVLNGWGPAGPQDLAGFNSALKEWDLFGEWMIAHRQNQVEWVLLADKTHQTFNDSAERIARLKKLVDMSHAWGLLTGIDVGVIFEQQNMWRLLRAVGTDQADSLEIRARVKYLMSADFDFMTAEMGSSEFTSPTDTKMLFWMNVLTDAVESVHNRYAAVKIHCSQGQEAEHFKDPDTGAPLNFNFLPMYADKRLAVLPHTVELYSLDDPAPTYGNQNWNEMHRFLSSQAGHRPVIWYPEATYWVSYDIDTPLFLPSYAERRLNDLRIIGREEDTSALGRGRLKGSRIQGQLLFVSGWEWGYWFNQAVAMHAAWNPRLNESSKAAFENITREILRPDEASMATADALIALLTDTVSAQNALLVRGVVNGKTPRTYERLTGMAYLAGQETWDELNTSLADILGIKKAPTQPNRLGFRSLRSTLTGQGVDFTKEVHPLLDQMESQFSTLSTRMIDLYRQTPADDSNKLVIAEFADGSLINTLRAQQVHALYDATATVQLRQAPTVKDQKLARAKKAIDVAVGVVARREKSYKGRFDKIAQWGANPTVYNYGYLWTVHSLYWWYRDEGNVTQTPSNACYMNIVNPANTVFAEGRDNTYYQWAQKLAELAGFGSIKECLNPSMIEPKPLERVRSAR